MAPPVKAKREGVSPMTRKTQIGLRIGSKVAMMEEVVALVMRMPLEKRRYPKDCWKMPMMMIVIQGKEP